MLHSTITIVILVLLKSRLDESTSCLSEMGVSYVEFLMKLIYDLDTNWTHMKLSPVLHFLAAATMKAFLTLTLLPSLSLSVSSFRFIRFSFLYNVCIIKESSNNFRSNFQNRHFCSYYPMTSLPLIENHIKPYITQNIYTSIQISLSVSMSL